MVPSLINLDRRREGDPRRMGLAMMGAGVGKGGRARDAALKAITGPLLEDVSIDGAKGVLINITSGLDLTIDEVAEASGIISEGRPRGRQDLLRLVFDESCADEMRITVIATGIDSEEALTANPPKPETASVTSLRKTAAFPAPPWRGPGRTRGLPKQRIAAAAGGDDAASATCCAGPGRKAAAIAPPCGKAGPATSRRPRRGGLRLRRGGSSRFLLHPHAGGLGAAGRLAGPSPRRHLRRRVRRPASGRPRHEPRSWSLLRPRGASPSASSADVSVAWCFPARPPARQPGLADRLPASGSQTELAPERFFLDLQGLTAAPGPGAAGDVSSPSQPRLTCWASAIPEPLSRHRLFFRLREPAVYRRLALAAGLPSRPRPARQLVLIAGHAALSTHRSQRRQSRRLSRPAWPTCWSPGSAYLAAAFAGCGSE